MSTGWGTFQQSVDHSSEQAGQDCGTPDGAKCEDGFKMWMFFMSDQQFQWGLYFINLVLCEQSLVHWEGPKRKRKKVLAAGIPVGHDDKNPGAAQSANSRSGPLALMDKHQGPEWWAMESCTDWLSFQLLQAFEKCEKDGLKKATEWCSPEWECHWTDEEIISLPEAYQLSDWQIAAAMLEIATSPILGSVCLFAAPSSLIQRICSYSKSQEDVCISCDVPLPQRC